MREHRTDGRTGKAPRRIGVIAAAWGFFVAALASACAPGAPDTDASRGVPQAEGLTVPLVSERWTLQQNHSPGSKGDSARFERHLGRPSLFVADGFASAKGVDWRNGTVEADVAAYPEGAFFGLAFHVQSADQYEVVFFRPGSASESVQYSPSFLNMNAWQLFSGPEYTASPEFPLNRWVHIRIVVKGLVASLFLDTASTPTIEIHDLTLGSVSGTIGFWARGGGGYISNVRYRPDTATYPLVHTHTFARGAITEGWSISDAFPISQTDPDVYPKAVALRWQPVQAEREGVVLIGRYRKDPRVESPKRLTDEPAKAAPGSEVVFARTMVTSDRDMVRKMWIGYSDDVVVYLNGHPLYAGRNSMSYRDPHGLGWFYPYADAVFLPLRKGANELLLAVTETSAGWAFMCRFDAALP